MIESPNRSHAVILLFACFAAGTAVGVAADRVYSRVMAQRGRAGFVVSANQNGFVGVMPPTRREEPRRNREGEIEADRIPMPLEALDLTENETRELHEIARRWRPRAGEILQQMRGQVSELENGMFAEMLCVISPEKQRRYRSQLEEMGGSRELIEKRFRLVNARQCPPRAADSTRR